MRVAYFTVVPFHVTNSGGAICCLNDVRRLAQEEELEVSVFHCVNEPDVEANREVVEAAGASYEPCVYRWDAGIVRRAKRRHPIAHRWPFQYERLALSQPHVDVQLGAWLRETKPDVAVVDYVPSALFVRSLYRGRVPRVTITLNWEAHMYGEMRATGSLIPETSGSWIANRRLDRFERWVYRTSNAVVALAPSDLEMLDGRAPIRELMPPALDPRPERWRWSGKRSLLFVGNRVHHPNLMAMEWLATGLAPELERVGDGVQIRIIGAEPESVPLDWNRANVALLGIGDDELLLREQTEAGMFVAPIENKLGSKFKLLTCLAHGTPFAATAEAMSGLSFLSGPTAQIHLDRPAEAAASVVGLLDRPERLTEDSERLERELVAFIERQRGSWTRLLRRVVAS